VSEGRDDPAPGTAAEVFEERFRAHRGDVERLCRRMLGSQPAGEDAVQEVFLRARRGFAGYDPERPFRSWLLAVAGNHCVDQIRRRGLEAQLFDARDLDAGDLRDPGPTPLRDALAREERVRVREAIDALPHRYRLPLVLRYFQELDYDGIAQILGVGRGQVGTLLFRAKRELRRRLAEDAAP
jgi:RNA polymerase sigma-70 factor (ECF subfamily)